MQPRMHLESTANASTNGTGLSNMHMGAGPATRLAFNSEPTGIQIAQQLIRTEGFCGVWRGTGATIACYAPNSAVWWLTHEQSKTNFSRLLGTHEEHVFTLALSGSLAGICATIFTNPLDVVKTRVQCSESPRTVLTICREILSESGWRGFYSGIVPRLLSSVPRSVFSLVAYERAISFCRVDTTESMMESI